MFFDEFYFHRRRGLGRWERIGHPLDTATVLLCYVICLTPFSATHFQQFLGLSLFSCIFVTKDEFVHARECEPGEMWLHSLLFILHPIAFMSAGVIWYLTQSIDPSLVFALQFQAVLIFSFAIYQIIYWNFYGGAYGKSNRDQ